MPYGPALLCSATFPHWDTLWRLCSIADLPSRCYAMRLSLLCSAPLHFRVERLRDAVSSNSVKTMLHCWFASHCYTMQLSLLHSATFPRWDTPQRLAPLLTWQSLLSNTTWLAQLHYFSMLIKFYDAVSSNSAKIIAPLLTFQVRLLHDTTQVCSTTQQFSTLIKICSATLSSSGKICNQDLAAPVR